jgi:hypothetical protein
MIMTNEELILQAAQAHSIFQAACFYTRAGLNVLPLKGKQPHLRFWQPYQTQAISLQQVLRWHRAGLFSNIGIVCGKASRNLVVLDLDGMDAYKTFCHHFLTFTETYTVLTGSGMGVHLYWYTEHLPATTRILSTSLGHLELLAQGHQVVAPPSQHPVTGHLYRVLCMIPIQHVRDLRQVVTWLRSFRPHHPVHTPAKSNNYTGRLNPRLIDAISSRLLSLGYKPRQDWLNGGCIYPNRHRNGDRHPSFGFNRQSGYGYCFVCGTLLAKDIGRVLHIDIDAVGGLWAD